MNAAVLDAAWAAAWADFLANRIEHAERRAVDQIGVPTFLFEALSRLGTDSQLKCFHCGYSDELALTLMAIPLPIRLQ